MSKLRKHTDPINLLANEAQRLSGKKLTKYAVSDPETYIKQVVEYGKAISLLVDAELKKAKEALERHKK